MTADDEVRWLDDAERRAWMGYRRMKGLLDLQIARDLQADSGLSDADYHVLSTLSETVGEDWRLRSLAERLLWSPSRLAHQLTRMEQRGLVIREACPDDARGASIAISDEGQRTVERAAPRHVRSVRRHLIDVLSREQLEALAEISESILANLSDTSASLNQ
jgi:DNA-binding MarR family transcriptional regulator